MSTYSDRVNELLRNTTHEALFEAARTIDANCAQYHYAGETHDEDVCTLLALIHSIGARMPQPRVYARTVSDGLRASDRIG